MALVFLGLTGLGIAVTCLLSSLWTQQDPEAQEALSDQLLVRLSVHVLARDGNPIAGARVLFAPIPDVLETDEGVEDWARMIRWDLEQTDRWVSSTGAMGTTDDRGVAKLEYRRPVDTGPLLKDDGLGLPGSIVGGALRVDVPGLGPTIRWLPRRAKGQLHETPRARPFRGVAEFEHEFRLDK